MGTTVKGLSLSQSMKNLQKIASEFSIVATGTGTPWYTTKTDKAQKCLATVLVSQDGKTVYLVAKVTEDIEWYINPSSEKNFRLIQGIDEKYHNTEIEVTIAPQVLNDISDAQITAVEERYGKDASRKYKQLKAENKSQVALIEMPVLD